MTKYYYTDPIKAAYMMMEFGVKINLVSDASGQEIGFEFVTFEGSDDVFKMMHYIYGRAKSYGDGFKVHPDSEHIFEPRPWDRTIFTDGAMTSFNRIEEDETAILLSGEQIIVRDNKHFFMPEVENDT